MQITKTVICCNSNVAMMIVVMSKNNPCSKEQGFVDLSVVKGLQKLQAFRLIIIIFINKLADELLLVLGILASFYDVIGAAKFCKLLVKRVD